ncbi:toll-like receptor Tollo [Sitodiplosis mosellana]|uniref:toll-like receptor Tollo n=1 Tax=Sitodiplosis mosellana TaxID=263140 RepID=UPI002443EC0C|nr:toll-like receptor Tollo [Sitodiplosis mosellana]
MFWNYDAEKIHVIRTGEKEGVLETSDGRFELHCNDGSFENILNFQAVSNQIENPTEMCHCLTSSLQVLELTGNFEETFDTDLLERFTNLTHLSLKGTQLKKFDLNVMKNHKNLSIIQLPGNNLTKIDNLNVLDNYEYPINLDISDNQLENVPEILKHLTSKTVDLNLSGNFVGKLNATTFERFKDMKRLILKNSSVSFDDLKPFEPFELNELDISRNNLENANFTSTSMALKQLQILNVGHCKVRNISEVVKVLGPSLLKLDLVGNFLGKLHAQTFDNIKMGLKDLNMSNTHLTDAGIAVLKHLTKLDISKNKVKSLNFTSVSNRLHTLYLNENDLKEVDNLTKSHFPMLRSLNISKNQFTCEYLAKFIAQLNEEWPHLMMFGDPWEQKYEGNCHPMHDDVIENP